MGDQWGYLALAIVSTADAMLECGLGDRWGEGIRRMRIRTNHRADREWRKIRARGVMRHRSLVPTFAEGKPTGKARGSTLVGGQPPPRNAPCPCGSGRKAKRCHPAGLAPTATAPQNPTQEEA